MQKFIIVGGAIVPMVGGVVTVMQFFFKADPCHLSCDFDVPLSLAINSQWKLARRREKKKERERSVITIKFFFAIPSH
jgi:hypothetical protein